MAAVQPPEIDPLMGHHKYQRLRHLSGGACGFVVLALDKSTGDLVSFSVIVPALAAPKTYCPHL